MKQESSSSDPKDGMPAVTAEFEKSIERQEDLMYGVALFFECISLLYAGQNALIETYRRQFRNIIQTGNDAAQRARGLLEQVKSGATEPSVLDNFRFSPCEGHPDPEKMLKRADILLQTYSRVFPDRPRSNPFSTEETLKLMECASEKIGH